MSAPFTAADARVFTPGRWIYCWNRTDWKPYEPTPAFLDMLTAHGITGVIMHSVEPVPDSFVEASEWCTPERVKAFNDRGIKVMIGIGFRNPLLWKQIAVAVIKAIDACKRVNSPCVGVNGDWEQSWDNHIAEARLLLAMILQAHPDAGLYLTMPSWWAPMELPSGGATHPHAPTAEWLAVIALDIPIDPQCYGAGQEGASKRMLGWSRHEYMLHYGLPAWRVIPGIQMYHLTLFEVVDLLLTEDTISMWDWAEADSVMTHALRIAHVLRHKTVVVNGVAQNIVGANWVVAFQTAYGLTVDNIVGPYTRAALAAVCP